MWSSVKPSSQNKFCNLYPILAWYYYRKVKANQDCKRVTWKCKEGWEEANSWHVIYPVVSVGTTPSPHCWSTPHKSVASRSPSLSQEHHLTSHKGSPRKHSPSSLMPPPLRSFSTKDGGLHIPHKKCLHHFTPSRRVEDDCRWAT
jgi:hypothetical protein